MAISFPKVVGEAGYKMKGRYNKPAAEGTSKRKAKKIMTRSMIEPEKLTLSELPKTEFAHHLQMLEEKCTSIKYSFVKLVCMNITHNFLPVHECETA